MRPANYIVSLQRESLERKLEVATERANDAERNVKTLEQKLKAAQLNPKVSTVFTTGKTDDHQTTRPPGATLH